MNRAKLQEIFGSYWKQSVPERFRNTLLLRAFGLLKIPLLFSVQPTIQQLDDGKSAVRIRLNRWTRNHWGSMYFGTLAIGADCAVGMLAMHHIWKLKARNVALIFKDFHAEFLKRPDGHVCFLCDEGLDIKRLVEAAQGSDERQNLAVHARAVLESNPSEPVASFTLTLSLKRK